MSLPYTDSIDLLTGSRPQDSAGVTSSTVGTGVDISKRQQVTVQFYGNVTSGDGNFNIDVSNDGTHWIEDIAFLDANSTTPTTLVTSKAISTTTKWGGAIVTPGWKYIRASVDVTGTGTYYAFLEAAG